MMRLRALVAVVGLAATLTGCGTSEFRCHRDADCSEGDARGSCEDLGFCSFPSADCPSGRVYAEHSGSLAGLCVPVDDGATDGASDSSSTSTDTTAGPDPSTGGSSSTMALDGTSGDVSTSTGTDGTTSGSTGPTGDSSTSSGSATGVAGWPDIGYVLDDPQLVGWWTGSDPASVLVNGGAVTQWNNQLAGGIPFTASGPLPGPTFTGAELVFGGTALQLAGPINADQDSTYVLRLTPTAPAGNFGEIVGALTDEPTFPTWHRNLFASTETATPCTDDRTDLTQDEACAGGPYTLNETSVLTLRLDTGGATVFLDNVPGTTETNWLLPAVEILALGATTSRGAPWQGEMSDVLIFSRGLTDEEIGALFTELSNPPGP